MLGKALAAAAKAVEPAYVEDVFQTWLYAGNSSTQTITNGVDLAGKGGLVWIKNRTQGTVAAASHVLHDSARGVTNYLSSNSTNQEFDATTGGVTAFNATGFDLGSLTRYNNSGDNYASWTFRKQAKFFDVVTWTGNDVDGRTVAHNLGSVPGCIIVKRTDTGGTGWAVYHRSLLNTQYLVLNTTAATATNTTFWSSTTPTSTEFTLGTVSWVNASGGTYVAYLFAHDAGGFGAAGTDSIIKCGSYTGNGSTTGPSIDLGWEPQWVAIKRTSGVGDWYLYDNFRGAALDFLDSILLANSSAAEDAISSSNIHFTTTGFQLATSSNTHNGSGDTYIYIAIRRGPMKTPTDATKVFQAKVYTGTNVDNRLVTTDIVTDMAWVRQRNDTVLGGMVVGDRMRGQRYLLTGATDSEVDDANSFSTYTDPIFFVDYGNAWSSMTGFWVGNDATSKLNYDTTSNNQIAYAFRRAPGFFDVVAYTGTGASQSLTHNLSAAPELIIVKARSTTSQWRVGAVFASTTYATGDLNNDTSWTTGVSYGSNWFSAQPTSTTFGVTSSISASSTTYIAYLFASCSGVSKVGSYTGTGTTLSIDCGFTNGARFVLIKRTDSTGDWYVWDTARGIVSGNDPYLLLNSTAAEVTNTDYIDPLNSGFQISSTAPAAINANGGTFIYLAVA